MLERSLKTFGLWDDFVKIVQQSAGMNQDLSTLDMSAWERFDSWWQGFQMKSGDKAHFCKEVDPLNFLNCVVQENTDSLCGYVDEGSGWLPRTQGQRCYEEEIRCADYMAVSNDDCTAKRTYHCEAKPANTYWYMCLLDPGQDIAQLCSHCAAGNTQGCDVSYQETSGCRRFGGGVYFSPSLTQIDMGSLAPGTGCTRFTEGSLNIGPSAGTFVTEEPGICYKQQGNLYNQRGCSIDASQGTCAPMCLSSGSSVCCPQLDQSGAWDRRDGLWREDCPVCSQQMVICEGFCQLKEVLNCQQEQPAQQNPEPPVEGGGSCPYVYSIVDGEEVLEEDLLVTQYGTRMDWPYYTQLDSYDPEKGILVVKEHLRETTYIDSIELLRAGTGAMMTGDGQMIAIGDIRPVRCTTKNGEDCTRVVDKKDSRYFSPLWEVPLLRIIAPGEFGIYAYSTPSEYIDIRDPATYKDYLELELPEGGYLLVSYSMTEGMAFFEPRLASDLAGILPGVYAGLNNRQISERVAGRLMEAGFARIMVLEDGQWMPYSEDYNSNFISLSEKDTIVRLDRSRAGDRIRLEFTSGLYAFDYVAVAHGEPAEAESIGLLSARLTDDVLERVAAEDKDYAVLHQGDELVMAFERTGPGTYFLRTTGYYQPFAGEFRPDAGEAKFLLELLFEDNSAEQYLLSQK